MLDKYAAESFWPRCSETFINPWFSIWIFIFNLDSYDTQDYKTTRLQQNIGGYFPHARSLRPIPIPVKTSSKHVLISEFAHLKCMQDCVLVDFSVTWQKLWNCLNLLQMLVREIIVFLQPHIVIPRHCLLGNDKGGCFEKLFTLPRQQTKILHPALAWQELKLKLWLPKNDDVLVPSKVNISLAKTNLQKLPAFEL